MANTSAIAGASADDYAKLSAAAREAGKATTFTASEAADALGYMALAGWNVEESTAALTPVLKLAEATQADLATTSDQVTDSMSAMGVGIDDLQGSATRLAKKMERSKEANRGYFHRHIEAMLSYMGWFTCTDTYDCYQSRIKPYIHVGRLKKIISKIKRRQNHEGMDQGKMLRGAAGAAACG